jgi:hypothetical protein
MGLFFAAPLYLAGFLSLAVPFLLLFTKARTSQKTPFSSVQFLRSLTEKATRTIEWKKMLLLVLRLLLLACLVLGFSMPFFSKSGWRLYGRPKVHHVLVLDNSYSMNYFEEGRSLFDRAKDKARAFAQQKIQDGDLVSLYAFNRELEPVVTSSRGKKEILSALDGLWCSELPSDFDGLPAALRKVLEREKELPAAVHLFSDFAAANAEERAGIERFLAQEKKIALDTIVLEPREYINFAVEDVVLPDHPFLPGKEEEVRAHYRSWGMRPGSKVVLDLWSGGTLVQSQEIAVPENGKGWASFRVRFPGPGRYPLKIESSADALQPDNVRYAIANVHDPLRFFLVEDKTYERPFESPYYYWMLALSSFGGPEEEEKWFRIAKSRGADLRPLDSEPYDLVLLADVESLGPKDLNSLQSYVKRGGTVFFAPGSRFARGNYRKDAYLEKILGGRLGEPEQPGAARQFHLRPVDYGHPMLRIFDQGRQGDLGRIPFSSFTPYLAAEGEGDDRRILLWFEDRWPALVEKKTGKGKVFVWTTSLGQEWTDFPKSPLFVPFVFEFLKYAVQKSWTHGPVYQAGDEAVLARESAAAKSSVIVKDPLGEQTTLYTDARGELPPVVLDKTGIYEWFEMGQESAVWKSFAVNVAVRESDPLYVDPLGTRAETPKPGTATAGNAASLTEKNFFYLPFFAAVLLLLLAEAWVANRFYQPQWV